MSEDPRSRDVAIVGMSALFPGAANLEQYWQNIVDGVDAIQEAPDEWASPYFDPGSEASNRIYTRRGGFIRGLAEFSAAEFGIMPNSIDGGDPDGYVVLQLARDALADAGYLDREFDRSKAGVILGRGNYSNRGQTSLMQHGLILDQTVELLKTLVPEIDDERLERLRESLREDLPPFSPEMISGLVPNAVTGRVANRLDLMGPNYLVDAACASSLLAIELGIKELHSGRCDMVLAGGVHASNSPPISMIFCQIGALSRSELRPFGSAANGTLLGEGVGIVVLKRRSDAERDGDRIYAVVKGVGSSSDGQAKGIMTPRLEGEVLSLRRAYEDAEVDPTTVGLIEAHGTGIPLGDKTEVDALGQVFGARQGTFPNCAIGSVKSMISHCLPAAGAAGVIKAALALHHRVLPPTLCEEVSPELGLEKTPFYVNNRTRPWVHGGTSNPRRAGVNSFGFGGINAHLILEEVDDGERAVPAARGLPSEVVTLTASDRPALLARIDALREQLDGPDAPSLVDLAATLAGEEAGVQRLAVVTQSLADLDRKLARARTALEDPERRTLQSRRGTFFAEAAAPQGKTAFLFPGEGAQYPNMLADLCLAFPGVRRWFDRLDEAFRGERDGAPSAIIFPAPTALAPEQQAEAEARLFGMDAGSEAVSTANLALAELLTALGVRGDVMLGHSTGEFAALVVSGIARDMEPADVITRMRELNAVYRNLEAEERIAKGRLLAVGALEHAQIREVVAEASGDVHLAMDNCRNQAVIYVPDAESEAVHARLKSLGAIVMPLPFDRAYHTPLFEDVARAIREFYQDVNMQQARTPLYSCTSTSPFPSESEAIRDLAAAQWSSPVRFRETILKMHDEGVRTFIEVGPRNNLTAFVNDILHDREHLALASNVQHRSALEQVQSLCAQLFVRGHIDELGGLFEHRTARAATGSGSAGKAPRMKLELGLPVMRMSQPVELPSPPAPASPAAEPSPQSARPAAAAAAEPTPAPAALAPAPAAPPLAPSAPPVPPAAMVPAAPADPRLAALDGHFKLMQDFMSQQARMMGLVGTGTAAASPPAVAPASVTTATRSFEQDYPLLGRVLLQEPDRLVTERTFELGRDHFLVDHTIGVGGKLSRNQPDAIALAVVPFTMSMEAIAEAARLLVGGGEAFRLRDLMGYRWIALDHGAVTVRITARRETAVEGAEVVHVRMTQTTGPGSTEELLVFEGRVELSATAGAAPAPLPFDTTALAPAKLGDDMLYRTGMFHGPRWRGVTHLRGVAADRIEADMQVLRIDDYFGDIAAPSFMLDAGLLDAAGQLLGFWSYQIVDPATNVFPFQVERYERFADMPPPGTPVLGRAVIRREGEATLRADIDMLDGQGRVLARLSGWRDRVFPTADHAHAWRMNPQTGFISEPWLTGSTTLVGRRITPQRGDFLKGSGDIWLKVAAHMSLRETERAQWYALPEGSPRREEWLCGRLAAKDALRQWAKEIHGLELAPVDVEISNDPTGKPRVHCAFAPGVQLPDVSITHSDGFAGACVARDAGTRLGVDLERVVSTTISDLYDAAFTRDELASVSRLEAGDRRLALLSFWCAKEAAAKATGKGLDGAPKAWEITAFTPGQDRLQVTHAGEHFTVRVEHTNEEVMAVCEIKLPVVAER